ncbi:MAG: transcription-repair coupling factor, partial [Piscirickettsiaceae bacterium CG_4_9_14_0_2_um_filter_44_546]
QPELETQLHSGAEVELGVPTLIPETYLPDIHSRLVFYKRIASAEDESALQELQVEMIDRFGLLPPQVQNLMSATQIKLKLDILNLKKCEANESMIRLQFGSQPNIDPLALIKLIQNHPKHYQLKGQSELKYFDDFPEVSQRLAAINLLLTTIANKDTAC